MMGTKIRSFSPLPEDVSLENLVPEDHFYRRLEAAFDLDALPTTGEPELRAQNARRGASLLWATTPTTSHRAPIDPPFDSSILHRVTQRKLNNTEVIQLEADNVE